MLDRDGTQCPWNNRWQAGVHILNEQMPLRLKRVIVPASP